MLSQLNTDIKTYFAKMPNKIKLTFNREQEILNNNNPELFIKSQQEYSIHLTDNILEKIILSNLVCNICQWVLEDRSRDTKVSAGVIARMKKSIDTFNQKRNDLIEEINEHLIANYFKKQKQDSPLFSETPGSVLDRINILRIRQYKYKKLLYNTSDDTLEIKQRSKVVEKQITDLESALFNLFKMSANGKMHFQVYKQLKTYNDARFNLYIKK